MILQKQMYSDKVSIIIVSWNVSKLLKRCLASIYRTSSSLVREIIVIDNGSCDGSVDMVRQSFPQVQLIASEDNRGFAAACNQGIARAKGDYFLFLNPDTEVTPRALDELVAAYRTDTRIGIAAPQLLNTDGTIQESVRLFPTFFRQLLNLLKVHRFFPRVRPFVFGIVPAAVHTAVSDSAQPMGAALLVSKAVCDRVGPFDEDFYLWFEEVDFCHRVQDAGFRIISVPSARIIHHGGSSFAQVEMWEKQKHYFASCARYFRKHGSLFQRIGGSIFFGYSRLCNLLSRAGTYGRRALVAFCIIGGIELLSYIGYHVPLFNTIGFFLITIGTFIISLRTLSAGASILCAELVIGSKGYLFSYDFGFGSVSIRMGIFGAFLLAWLVSSVRTRKPVRILQTSFGVWYARIACIILFGIVNGIISGAPLRALFLDANAWLFFLIALPLFDAVGEKADVVRIGGAVLGAVLAHMTKVLALFYIMGHQGFGYDLLVSVYRWVRTTGIGEITDLGSHVSRVFLQSSVYIVVAFFVLFSLTSIAHIVRSVLRMRSLSFQILLAGCWISVCAVLFVSFSRSFAVALFATVFAGGIWFFQKRFSLARPLFFSFLGFVLGAFVLFGIIIFPYPSTKASFPFDALASRVGDLEHEPSAASRWSSLSPLVDAIKERPVEGYGFGKELSYRSYDPRVLAKNSTGVFTTTAFEWGYLDILLKVGIIGFSVYLAFLGVVMQTGFRASEALSRQKRNVTAAFARGLTWGIVALALVHFFTPYINHPLGIGYLIVLSVLFTHWNFIEKAPVNTLG